MAYSIRILLRVGQNVVAGGAVVVSDSNNIPVITGSTDAFGAVTFEIGNAGTYSAIGTDKATNPTYAGSASFTTDPNNLVVVEILLSPL
jgi:hypothetical protein